MKFPIMFVWFKNHSWFNTWNYGLWEMTNWEFNNPTTQNFKFRKYAINIGKLRILFLKYI